jgi:hypothetical protein
MPHMRLSLRSETQVLYIFKLKYEIRVRFLDGPRISGRRSGDETSCRGGWCVRRDQDALLFMLVLYMYAPALPRRYLTLLAVLMLMKGPSMLKLVVLLPKSASRLLVPS